jgi:hypothetical protein
LLARERLEIKISWKDLEVAVYFDGNLVSHPVYLHQTSYIEPNIQLIMEYF